MDLRSHIACTSSDLARWGLRSVLKRQGGVVPGRVAMKIEPNLLRSLASLVDRSVVITGTNGKTTTTNLIADALAADGSSVVCNRAGNNMEPGIVGALLEGRKRLGSAAAGSRIGVFECDELYTVRVLPKLKPDFFVLLNLFRDQLDRYGEIDHTQDVIAQALEKSPDTVLIFNADDPLCAAIANRVPNRSMPFGIDGATGTESDRISDSRFCPQCNAPLDYDYVQYGQLGSYHCPACGWRRPELIGRAENIMLDCGGGYRFDLATGIDAPRHVRFTHLDTKYNGLYMVYNVAAAFFAATQLGARPDRFQTTLDAYVPAGGRMEEWNIAGRAVVSNLAKNPVGFDRQIQQIKTSGGRLAAFYLNDNDADGHDVSWIWDVDFERIADTPGLIAFAGGTRAHDMQVRLKYAGIDATIIDGLAPAIAAVADEPSDEKLYAVANYTAFPPLVKELGELKDVAASDLAGSAAPIADGSGVPAAGAPIALDRPLRIVYLYPDALNLYGDGGNVIALAKRCEWHGVPAVVDEVRMGDTLDLSDADIIMAGGGADRDQLAVANELLKQKEAITAYVEDGGVMLAICGSYQLLGRSYYMGDQKVEGLGVIGVETVRGEGRMIGNVAVKTPLSPKPFVGFENHGGRTILDADTVALGTSVVAGTGNNGDDGFEGTLYKGVVGTYLHGPALPKNPELADWLITQALKRRGTGHGVETLPLTPLDDSYEHAAHEAAMKLLK